MGENLKGETAGDRDLENSRKSSQRPNRSSLTHLPKHLRLAIISYDPLAGEPVMFKARDARKIVRPRPFKAASALIAAGHRHQLGIHQQGG